MDNEKNLHVNPVEKEKSTDSIVNKIFIEDILRGTGFENGKKHIYELRDIKYEVLKMAA